MKSILKITAVCMLLLTSTIALATEPNPKLSTDIEAKSLILELDTKGQKTKLKLIDTNYEVLYFESIIDVKLYKKKFDFSELKKGAYSLIVENTLNLTIHNFTVGVDKIVMTGKTENNKPYFRIMDERIAINYMNLTKEGVVISIYDSENRTVFSEKLNDIIVEKAFNFEKAYADNYTIVVKTKNKSYSENILIE